MEMSKFSGVPFIVRESWNARFIYSRALGLSCRHSQGAEKLPWLRTRFYVGFVVQRVPNPNEFCVHVFAFPVFQTISLTSRFSSFCVSDNETCVSDLFQCLCISGLCTEFNIRTTLCTAVDHSWIGFLRQCRKGLRGILGINEVKSLETLTVFGPCHYFLLRAQLIEKIHSYS